MDESDDDPTLCWTKFVGEWGGKGRGFLAHPGQFGPTMKGCYMRGDFPMRKSNVVDAPSSSAGLFASTSLVVMVIFLCIAVVVGLYYYLR